MSVSVVRARYFQLVLDGSTIQRHEAILSLAERTTADAHCSCFPRFDQREVLLAEQYDNLVVLKSW